MCEGLKSGAHAGLMLPNAYERISAFRSALEDRFGPQPPDALIFQVLGPDGPEWTTTEKGELVPLAWTKNFYNRWTKRVFIPAREVAARAPDSPAGLDKMVFCDCRHSAISLALRSTLVIGPSGMNLHPLFILWMVDSTPVGVDGPRARRHGQQVEAGGV